MKTDMLKRIKSIGIVIMCLVFFSVEVRAMDYETNSCPDYELAETNAFVYEYQFSSEITNQSLFGEWESAFDTSGEISRRVTGDDTELGGVERLLPVGNGLLIFLFIIVGYAILTYRKETLRTKKTNRK